METWQSWASKPAHLVLESVLLTHCSVTASCLRAVAKVTRLLHVHEARYAPPRGPSTFQLRLIRRQKHHPVLLDGDQPEGQAGPHPGSLASSSGPSTGRSLTTFRDPRDREGGLLPLAHPVSSLSALSPRRPSFPVRALPSLCSACPAPHLQCHWLEGPSGPAQRPAGRR